jgi:hypothetical protein
MGADGMAEENSGNGLNTNRHLLQINSSHT